MNALFHQVLTMSLSAGFLVGIILLFRLCFRRVPKWVHCILWGLVAVRLLCPALPKSQLSMVPEKVSDSEHIVQIVEEMSSMSPLPSAQMEAVQAAPDPVPVEEAAPIAAPIEDVSPAPAATLPPPVFTPAPAEPREPIDWMRVLCWVWLAGIAAMAVYGAAGYMKVRQRVSASVDVGHGIFLCDYIDTPFLMGIRSPRIYLPSQLDSGAACYVLAHERAHIQRRDHWWKPLGYVLLSVHWFNPMIWIGYILLCRDIEMACDESVIRSMEPDEKKQYSRALLTCSLPRPAVSICPLGFGEVGVKERIRNVLKYRRPALWLTLVGLAAVIVGAVLFLTDPVKQVETGDVEYYPTADYSATMDRLTLTEYDKEFRVTSRVEYWGGKERNREEFSYERHSNTLIRTCVYTYLGTSGRVFSDGATVSPGKSVTFVYTETLDDNGNVLESICTADGVWSQTETCTYDAAGNLILKTKKDSDSVATTENSFDESGNLLRCIQTLTIEDHDPSVVEMLYTYNDKGNVMDFKMYHGGFLSESTQTGYDYDGRISIVTTSRNGEAPFTYQHRYEDNGCTEFITSVCENGSIYGETIQHYDVHGNLLYSSDSPGSISATNYIGTDGSKSIGIPEEIYSGEVTAHPELEPKESDNVILEALDVTPTGARLNLRIAPGVSLPELSIGHPYTLYRETDSRWQEVKTISGTSSWIPREISSLPFNGGWYHTDWYLSWAKTHGVLPAGHYRIETRLASYGQYYNAEFTIPAAQDPEAEAAMDLCTRALQNLAAGESWQVEILWDNGSRNTCLRSGYNYLYTTHQGSAPDPVDGKMHYKTLNYRLLDGRWAFDEDPGVFPLWYEPFAYDHSDLTLLENVSRDGAREITFAVASRPDRELRQKDHTVTFRLNDAGELLEVRESGTITNYNGEAVNRPYTQTATVRSTDDRVVASLFHPEELESYGSFSWETDQANLHTQGSFQNTKPSSTETVLKVYRLAQKEYPTNSYVTAQVARDEDARMWRVEFRHQGSNGGYVYLDDQGITRGTGQFYSESLTPDQISAAVEDCKAVVNEVQRAEGYCIETYEERYVSGSGWDRSTFWALDQDWMQQSLVPTSDTDATLMGWMYQNGQYFDNELCNRTRNAILGWRKSRSPQEHMVIWLASVKWEQYDITLSRIQETEEGRTVQLSLRKKPNFRLDDCLASFSFDSGGTFTQAVIETLNGNGQVIRKETCRIRTLDPDTIRAEMQKEYDRALQQGTPNSPKDSGQA